MTWWVRYRGGRRQGDFVGWVDRRVSASSAELSTPDEASAWLSRAMKQATISGTAAISVLVLLCAC